jgi:hypothetical protein
MNAFLIALMLAAAPEDIAGPPAADAQADAAPVMAPPRSGAWPRPARDTADVGPKGRWSTGIFNPTRYALTDSIELEANPLLLPVAPNLIGRFALMKSTTRLTAEAGVLVPTFGMRLMKGYFFPTWATSTDNIGWMVIPRVAVLLSGGAREHDVWTARADFAFRVPLGANSASPIESFVAPLDLLLAAPLTGYLARVGGAYDAALGNRFRLRGELNLYWSGATPHLFVNGVDVGQLSPRSPLYVTGHVGVDIAVFKHSRITLGVLWANYDQGASIVVKDAAGFADRVPVRSNNILPTIDYIWAGGFGD